LSGWLIDGVVNWLLNNWEFLFVNVLIKSVLNVLWSLFLISDDNGGSGFLFLASFLVTSHVGTKRFESGERGDEFFEGVKMANNEGNKADFEKSAAVMSLFVIFLSVFVIFLSVSVVFLVFLTVSVMFLLFNSIGFKGNSMG
jgi:hypothetical protein